MIVATPTSTWAFRCDSFARTSLSDSAFLQLPFICGPELVYHDASSMAPPRKKPICSTWASEMVKMLRGQDVAGTTYSTASRERVARSCLKYPVPT